MTDRPILFSGPMVRALLADTKTQTRRALRIQPNYNVQNIDHVGGLVWKARHWDHEWVCRYGIPGDRLWVRETFCTAYEYEPGHYSVIPFSGCDEVPRKAFYRASDTDPADGAQKPWKPSIHMPRWASRITLELNGVRVERLKDITETDAIAEGVQRNCDGLEAHPDCPPCRVKGKCEAEGEYIDYTESEDGVPAQSARESYQSLWNHINGAGSWDANPWVWVVSFKRVEA